MDRRFCSAVAILLLTSAAFVARSQAEDPLDSLKVCSSTQHLMFENAFVRVIDDVIPAGVTEPMHRHRHGVVVYLTDYTVQQTNADGKATTSERKANTATWSEAVVHSVKNTGATPSHAIRIELKQ